MKGIGQVAAFSVFVAAIMVLDGSAYDLGFFGFSGFSLLVSAVFFLLVVLALVTWWRNN